MQRLFPYSFSKKGYRGHISLMVLFVLSVVAMLAVTSTQRILFLLGQVQNYDNFLQSYYYARGNAEIGLQIAETFGFGYQDIITDTTHPFRTFADRCTKDTDQCILSIDISNRGYNIIADNITQTDTCTQDIAFTLDPGAGLVLPLFVDIRTMQNKRTPSDKEFSLLPELDLNIIFPNNATGVQNTGGTDIILSFVIGSGFSYNQIDRDILTQKYTSIDANIDQTSIIMDFLDDTTPSTGSGSILSKRIKFGQYQNFLGITNNASGSQLIFCLQSNNDLGIATQNTDIIGRASYKGFTNEVRARKTNILPDRLLQTVIEY